MNVGHLILAAVIGFLLAALISVVLFMVWAGGFYR